MRCWVCQRVVVAVLLASCQLALAAVDVRLRNVDTSAGPAFNWLVTSSIGSQHQNITLYSNNTGITTFRLDVKRTPAGSGYTVSGRVVLTNTPDAPEPVYVESVKMLLGPGLPWFGPTPRTLDCRSRAIAPGESVSCAFRLHMANTLTTSIKPSVDIRGERAAVQGDAQTITYPAAATTSRGNSDCAIIRDRVVADGLAGGFAMSGSGGAAQLAGGGVRVCDDSASIAYAATVGPFDSAEGSCGTYQYKNAPAVDIEGFGSATIMPATGSLFIGGCRQKDILGMLKPMITISKLSVAKLANTSWIITTSSGLPDGREPLLHYNSTAVVKSVVHINKTVSAPVKALVGEVTLTNNQILPYLIGGVRLVVTRDSSSSKRNTISSNGSISAAAFAPDQLFVDANCPVSSQGNILVPSQLVAAFPGIVRCTFDVPITPAFEVGTIQAQYKTLIFNSYQEGLDSGAPVPYSFAGNATSMESGSCVDVWMRRITNETEVTEADVQMNPSLSVAMAGIRDYAYGIVRTARYVGGRMPPVRNSFLAMPYTVCSNTTMEWSELYGPYTPDDCGTAMSIVTITASDSKTKDKDLAHAALATPLIINGCGMVPQVTVADVQLTAKKVFTWNVEKITTPSEGVSLNYDMQGLVKFDILYTRNYQVSDYRFQGLVALTNPNAVPITVTRVVYSVSRPHAEPLTGVAVCNETFADAAQAAADAAAMLIHGGVSNSFTSPSGVTMAVPNAVTSFTLPANPTATAPRASGSGASNSNSGGSSDNGQAVARLRLNNPGLRLDNPSSSAAAAAQPLPMGSAYGQQAQLGPDQAPQPFYCSFVVPTPDDYASDVSVRVMTNKGEEVTAQAAIPLDWTRATLYESGRCAQVSSTFQQTQVQAGATLLQPASISGAMPPAADRAVRVCDPVTYSFKALFGPFKENQCGVQQAIISAAVAVPGLQPEKVDNSATIINVGGCPAALPILTLAPATATQITSGYEWTIERSMRPLAPAAAAPVATAAGPGPGLNTPPVAGLAVSASSGSVALFNQTITFRRSNPIPFTGTNKKFQVKGTLNIVNPGDSPLTLTNVEVKFTQPGVKRPVTTRVYCPMSYYKPSPTGKGLVLEVPPATQLGGQPLPCTYGAMLNSQVSAEVTASAITAPDNRWARSSNSISVVLTDIMPLTVGGCVKVNEQQSLRSIVGNVTLPEPGFVGTRAPKKPEQLCFTKTYQTIGQIGPLKPVPSGSRPAAGKLPPGVSSCGAVKFSSVATAEPTTGYQGKLISAGELQVNIVGCHLAS